MILGNGYCIYLSHKIDSIFSINFIIFLGNFKFMNKDYFDEYRIK
jgi:hypothetical protein